MLEPALSARLPCPVCLGVQMRKVSLGGANGARVELDHCERCGGLWVEHGEAAAVRDLGAEAFWKQIAVQTGTRLMACHDCHAPLARDQDSCEACGWKNVLDCPCCSRPMKRQWRGDICLDLCKSCKGVWFDHAELTHIWEMEAAQAVARRPGNAVLHHGADDAADLLLHVLWYAPDLPIAGAYAAGQMISGAADAASHLPEVLVTAPAGAFEALAAAPEAAFGVVEAAGEAAGGVFSALAEIISGIFGAFGD